MGPARLPDLNGWFPDLSQVRSFSSQSSSTQQEMNPIRNLMGRIVSRPALPESLALSHLQTKDYASSNASSHHSETIPRETHHFFSRLPVELQLQIWAAAAKQEPDDGSRVFSLTWSSHRFAHSGLSTTAPSCRLSDLQKFKGSSKKRVYSLTDRCRYQKR
jgi:hypothetical protein